MYFHLAPCLCLKGDHPQLHWATSQHAWGPFTRVLFGPVPSSPSSVPTAFSSSPAQTQGGVLTSTRTDSKAEVATVTEKDS